MSLGFGIHLTTSIHSYWEKTVTEAAPGIFLGMCSSLLECNWTHAHRSGSWYALSYSITSPKLLHFVALALFTSTNDFPGKKGCAVGPSTANPQFGNVSDLNHQVWVLQGETLVANPRSQNVVPVTITLITCKYPELLESDKGTPIYLGIANPEMCLSCEDVEGQPTLQLKKEKIMDLYNKSEPVKSFLFYRNQKGRTSTLQSVAFPGWFVASSKIGQPIFLTSELGKSYNTDFDLNIKS
ncbi:PREDICTED: interleukin-36 gamma [Chrysochloris asiatica]|uniref:Interleukin-1 n=1 Tax=Chrysochloris asiatica TaxID=185453 RepID=A0A9B0UAL1_CHRAS|nr:PREDICTED: interleukin-36 gamma [Chrysochloris asiatica]